MVFNQFPITINYFSRFSINAFFSQALKLADFSNVGTFWGIVNSLAPPSSLQSLLYGVFKKGMDPTSKNFCHSGGRWVTSLELANTADGVVTDELWTTSMLTLISEDIHDAGEHLVGVSISLKRGGRARLSVWIDNAAHSKLLGRQVHRALRRVAVEHRIALSEWHFEDFSAGNKKRKKIHHKQNGAKSDEKH